MKALLSLGVNIGDRRGALNAAVVALDAHPRCQVLAASSAYETKALLPPDAPPEWDRTFMNAAVIVQCALSPLRLLDHCQTIEKAMGRGAHEHWSPRVIDIDIVATDGPAVATERLAIPHPLASGREFVLAPAAEIAPGWRLESGGPTIVELRHRAAALPSWMQIVNATPDSFSGDGRLDEPESVVVDEHANFVDVGAESTRPGARLVPPDEERGRLSAILDHVRSADWIRPRLSIDTRNVQTAAWAVGRGVDVINDVSGLADPAMREVLSASSCDVVLMHSVSVPANPRRMIDPSSDPVDVLETWLDERLTALDRAGIAPSRVLLDPGIGFGKTPDQSFLLIRAARRLQRFGLRLVYGHSRKSFIRRWADVPVQERDIETLALSMFLAREGVDVIRVHAVDRHARFARIERDLR